MMAWQNNLMPEVMRAVDPNYELIADIEQRALDATTVGF
jgi:hypothetical protein